MIKTELATAISFFAFCVGIALGLAAGLLATLHKDKSSSQENKS